MRIFGFACIAFAVGMVSVSAQKKIITHEDVWLMKRVGAPVVSPDGKQVAFTLVEPDYDASKQVTDLWIVPADGSAAPRRMTATKAPESGAVWSPDGTRIAFSARREGDEVSQIYVLALSGGEALRVTASVTGASNARWRPDGKAILYESMAYPGAKSDEDNKKIAAERKARKWNARIYDSFPIRYWNAWLDDMRPHVFVQELTEGAKSHDVLAGTKLAQSPGFAGQANPLAGGQSLDPIWSPDGSEIVFMAAVNANETMYAETETQLFRIPAAGGEAAQISARGQSFASPEFAPDGKSLYALSQRTSTKDRLYSLSRIVRFAWPAAGAPSLVTEGWDRSVSSFTVTADSGTIIADAEDDGFDKLFQVKTAGGKSTALFEVKEGGYTDAVARPGVLVARYGTSAQPPEIVTIAARRGIEKRLTSFNAERLAQLDLPAVEHFWFTAKNGKRDSQPDRAAAALRPDKKYPLLAVSARRPEFDVEGRVLHALELPSADLPRLCPARDELHGFDRFRREVRGRHRARRVARPGPGDSGSDRRGGQAVSVHRSRPVRRPSGASYGGYLMNWFNGHTNQFKCLVNHAGAINNESQYGVNDGGLRRELRMGVPIWENGRAVERPESDPISQNFKTPMLITQGELDFRVPLSESMTTFKILQRLQGADAAGVFPDEGHWILRGENSKLHMQEVLGWLQKWL